MKKCRKWTVGVLLCGLVFAVSGCKTANEEAVSVDVPEIIPSEVIDATDNNVDNTTDSSMESPETESTESDLTDETETDEVEISEEFLVVIDAGHQRKGNSEKEPVGPGATDMKAKVTGGTTGVSTGLAEYELNLQVAFKLQEELEGRGYTVIMVRTEHDVNLSNSERATVANEAEADAFIRIHANGSENASIKCIYS